VKWMGGRRLKFKPKTEMKDVPTRYKTSSNTKLVSGSYVTDNLMESTSRSFCFLFALCPVAQQKHGTSNFSNANVRGCPVKICGYRFV
jgi:hypothetical protein